jgi:hypothetical protein
VKKKARKMMQEKRCKIPLPENAESRENEREKQRQRLADLIGKLLARYWIRSQKQTKNRPIDTHVSADD